MFAGESFGTIAQSLPHCALPPHPVSQTTVVRGSKGRAIRLVLTDLETQISQPFDSAPLIGLNAEYARINPRPNRIKSPSRSVVYRIARHAALVADIAKPGAV